jgi:flagellar biosynthetic protein FliR
MLSTLLPAQVFLLGLVFARLGSAFMLLPVYGEPFVPARLRLLLALLITLLVAPLLAARLPALPASPAALLLVLAGEIVVGLFLGSLARIFMAALTTAGMIIAYMSSLANALVNDPAAAQQGSIAGTFLTLVALLLIFALDLHHLLLHAVLGSYEVFRPGVALPWGDMAEVVSRLTAQSFLIALQLAAPFIAVGLIFFLGLGLLGRLMPQIQVFFVAMPLQVAVGVALLALTLPIALAWFIGRFAETIGGFAG